MAEDVSDPTERLPVGVSLLYAAPQFLAPEVAFAPLMEAVTYYDGGADGLWAGGFLRECGVVRGDGRACCAGDGRSPQRCGAVA